MLQTKGIGVDLLHLPRLTRLLTKRPSYAHRFARRILTKSEYRQFLKSSSSSTTTTTTGMVRWLGVRWAAKEAAFKAFGTRRGGLVWGDVEVGYYDSGQPFLWLFKGCERGMGRRGGLSISHDGEYLVAMAMI
ncbi:mitochondrial phosphopantetheinyl transferase B [Tuber indicum]|nr:mitochondrial phosphopantetheinyl transferase B [Tuber indicum]